MREIALLAALSLAACGVAATADGPCLRCPEIDLRGQEDLLCPESFAAKWEPLHQCRCAKSAPCAGRCPIWCAGGIEDDGCGACTASACSGELAACLDDRAGP